MKDKIGKVTIRWILKYKKIIIDLLENMEGQGVYINRYEAIDKIKKL